MIEPPTLHPERWCYVGKDGPGEAPQLRGYKRREDESLFTNLSLP